MLERKGDDSGQDAGLEPVSVHVEVGDRRLGLVGTARRGGAGLGRHRAGRELHGLLQCGDHRHALHAGRGERERDVVVVEVVVERHVVERREELRARRKDLPEEFGIVVDHIRHPHVLGGREVAPVERLALGRREVDEPRLVGRDGLRDERLARRALRLLAPFLVVGGLRRPVDPVIEERHEGRAPPVPTQCEVVVEERDVGRGVAHGLRVVVALVVAGLACRVDELVELRRVGREVHHIPRRGAVPGRRVEGRIEEVAEREATARLRRAAPVRPDAVDVEVVAHVHGAEGEAACVEGKLLPLGRPGRPGEEAHVVDEPRRQVAEPFQRQHAHRLRDGREARLAGRRPPERIRRHEDAPLPHVHGLAPLVAVGEVSLGGEVGIRVAQAGEGIAAHGVVDAGDRLGEGGVYEVARGDRAAQGGRRHALRAHVDRERHGGDHHEGEEAEHDQERASGFAGCRHWFVFPGFNSSAGRRL